MKKILLTVAAITCISVASFAQGRFSVGGELALPSGDWADFVGIGFGGSVRYESPINDNLSWMGTAGYVTFAEKDNSGLTFSMIPIHGGVKYYFTESFSGFYAGGEIGVTIAKATVDISGTSVSASDSEVSFAPSVGYHLGSIDLSARYQIITDANFIGVRIAYVIGGK